MKLRTPIEIFALGQQIAQDGTRVNLSEADASAMIQTLAKEPAWIVPGHALGESVKTGKVEGLTLKNGKLLLTEVSELDPTFAQIVNSGELNRVSIKIRPPQHPDNPHGTYVLRHVAFLGRSQPAVPGLADAQFSDPNLDLTFNPMETQDKDAEFAQREAAVQQREAEIQRRELEFARRQTYEPFLDGLVSQGRLRPGFKGGLLSLLSRLPEDLDIEFSQGDTSEKQKGVNFLKNFLSQLPQEFDLKPSPEGQPLAGDASFSAPPGYAVDPDLLKIHGKALQYQADHPGVGYVDAVRAVGG